MISRRASWNLSPNLLFAALCRRRERGLEIFDLVESNPTHVGLSYPETEIREALATRAVLSYEPSPRGLLSARQAIARHYACRGEAVDPDRILLTAGTSEAYGFLWKLLADPGDEILVPSPSYPLFEYLAALDSVVPQEYRLAYDGRWNIDLDSVRKGLTRRTRAIVVVHPNNPTGSYVRTEELDALAAIARERDLALIADEVFAEYPFSEDPARAGTVALREDVLCFSLSGLSKLALLPQVKLGWIVVGGPGAARSDAMARLEVISDTYLSVSASAQHGAHRLLEVTGPLRAAVRRRTAENLSFVRHMENVQVLPPEGGWYAVLRIPGLHADVDWAAGLVEEAGVHVHPGSFYGFPSEEHVVISLLPQPSVFQQGLERLSARLVRSGR